MPASEYDQGDDKYCVSARIDVPPGFLRRSKQDFNTFFMAMAKVSVSIQTLVETVHTTGCFEMF